MKKVINIPMFNNLNISQTIGGNLVKINEIGLDLELKPLDMDIAFYIKAVDNKSKKAFTLAGDELQVDVLLTALGKVEGIDFLTTKQVYDMFINTLGKLEVVSVENIVNSKINLTITDINNYEETVEVLAKLIDKFNIMFAGVLKRTVDLLNSIDPKAIRERVHTPAIMKEMGLDPEKIKEMKVGNLNEEFKFRGNEQGQNGNVKKPEVKQQPEQKPEQPKTEEQPTTNDAKTTTTKTDTKTTDAKTTNSKTTTSTTTKTK